MKTPNPPKVGSDGLLTLETSDYWKLFFFSTRALIFWGIFIAFTWFYLIRRIVSWDLWWHMAAARHYLENGFQYPPLGTFTFSPHHELAKVHRTILGDVIFYCSYWMFGYMGLQLLRITLVFFAVYVFMRMAKFRYNIWTLAGCILMVLGTLQIHLIKNAIFGLFFLGFLLLLFNVL